MNEVFRSHLQAELQGIERRGLRKDERVLRSPQAASIETHDGRCVINLCANNYLGLANDPRLLEAARIGLERYGFGMASARFICGTQEVHKTLEAALSEFLGTDDCLLYSSCFDANGGLFEALLDAGDAVISDALNHASIIDGVRLSKARRYRYANNDMADLEAQLRAADADGCRFKLVVTDGVFSMDGIFADLASICDLALRYEAMVMVDDSHAVGFVGEHGKGSHEYAGVLGRVDIITGTFGKALGGASGGYTAARTEIVALLRQRSRPYLFSNSLAPAIAYATLVALNLIASSGELRERMRRNSQRFRARMEAAGFRLAGKDHAIIPVMIGDAALAAKMADALLEEGIYVIGFSFPVVPQGQARIRAQMNAAHSVDQIDQAVTAFTKVGKALGVI